MCTSPCKQDESSEERGSGTNPGYEATVRKAPLRGVAEVLGNILHFDLLNLDFKIKGKISLGDGQLVPAGPGTKTIWPRMALFSDGKQGCFFWPNGFRAGRKTQTYGRYSMQTRVLQIALFEGFPNIPHMVPPTRHSVHTNEATTTTAVKNAPSWRVSRVPERYRGLYAVIPSEHYFCHQVRRCTALRAST